MRQEAEVSYFDIGYSWLANKRVAVINIANFRAQLPELIYLSRLRLLVFEEKNLFSQTALFQNFEAKTLI